MAVNVKRVYRVMKAHQLLLERHTGNACNGGMTVASQSIGRTRAGARTGSRSAATTGERVRIAFTLDYCDREAISWVATTGGIDSGDIRDLMIESVERRFRLVDRSVNTHRVVVG